MAQRRWGLILLSVISLVVLVYAGVVTAFSLPVTGDMERATRIPGTSEPTAGERALVVPIADPTVVPTFLVPGSDAASARGSLLLVADPGTTVPAQAVNASLVRALAFVAPTANGSFVPANVTLANLTFVVNGTVQHENVTVDVASLANGKTGFLVKTDASPDITFAATDHVVGTVARFDPGTMVYAMFALGAIGFLAPLVVLIVTHRGATGRGARGGAASVTAGVCRECRAPLEPGASFCTRCGAWQDGRRES